jgi:Leucine-rich repeat (LRR) protein
VSDVTALQTLTNLQYLKLTGTQLSDVTPLHVLKDCLKTLRLDDTPVSRNTAAMASLVEALPKTEIIK